MIHNDQLIEMICKRMPVVCTVSIHRHTAPRKSRSIETSCVVSGEIMTTQFDVEDHETPVEVLPTINKAVIEIEGLLM